jgi:hypothetical protein
MNELLGFSVPPLTFMGKSQNTPQLAVGMNGKRGFAGCRHILAFSLEDAPQLAAGFFTRADNGHLFTARARRR